jgi:hypothetical protein
MANGRRKTLSVHIPEGLAAPHEGERMSIRDVRERIEAIFNALGTEANPDTMIPHGQKNNGPEAAEYALADLLEKLAAARKKKAKEAAEKAGVFGDPKSYVNGDTVMVYNSNDFAISVKSGNPSRMIGKEETQAALEKHLPKKATEVLDECMKERAATRQIIVSMK